VFRRLLAVAKILAIRTEQAHGDVSPFLRLGDDIVDHPAIPLLKNVQRQQRAGKQHAAWQRKQQHRFRPHLVRPTLHIVILPTRRGFGDQQCFVACARSVVI